MCPLVYNIVHIYIGTLKIKYYLRPRKDVILVFKCCLKINVNVKCGRGSAFFMGPTDKKKNHVQPHDLSMHPSICDSLRHCRQAAFRPSAPGIKIVDAKNREKRSHRRRCLILKFWQTLAVVRRRTKRVHA